MLGRMAKFVSISVQNGCDVQLKFTPDTGVTNDITGWALQFTVRKSYGSTILLTKTTGAGQIVITNGPSGLYTVTLNAADLLAATGLAIGDYFCDVSRTDSGSKDILAIGPFEVSANVSFGP